MDISYDNDEIIRRCFKCDEPVFCNLNVNITASNNTFTLWNKFQILAYENLEFEHASKVIVPEFQIANLITSSNYLICLDCAGNVHTTSLKFKNAAQKRFKYGFQPREAGIMACTMFSEDQTICLKYESEAYFLSVHKINSDFNLEKVVIIMCENQLPLQKIQEKYILKTYHISEIHIENMKKVFNVENINIRNDYSVVLISFDKLSIYACLLSTKMTEDEVTLIKLYTCPSEISGIEFIESGDLNIVIGLTIGTLISLNTKDLKNPSVIYLNTAVHKFLAFTDNILYTDGMTLWKAEKLLSKDVNFSQLFVRNVKDFVKFGDQIICTTFMDLIYTFSIDDERSYVKPQTADEYSSAEKFIEDSSFYNKILEEVNKGEALIKLQTKERDYITALSVTNRQDVMDQIVKQKVTVYESYEEAILENADVLLPNKFYEYFEKESVLFLIDIWTTETHRLGDVLSNVLGDLRIHVILSSDNRLIKATTVKITDILKKIQLLIPLKTKSINITKMRVKIKIVTNMPGTLDAKQKIWAVLYRKTVILNSEHFIKLNCQSHKNICLKEPKETLEELIIQNAVIQHSSLFNFIDVTKERVDSKNWQMYVRLPTQYQELLQNKDTIKQFQSKEEIYFIQQFMAEDFFKSKTSLSLTIGTEKVNIEIDNDGFSNPALRISSHNVRIVVDIRNFLSNLIYSIFADFEPGKEFINHSFYITVENIQKAIKECVKSSSEDDILPLIEQFEKKVIGHLPI